LSSSSHAFWRLRAKRRARRRVGVLGRLWLTTATGLVVIAADRGCRSEDEHAECVGLSEQRCAR